MSFTHTKACFLWKNGLKSTNILCIGSHKSFPIQASYRGKFLKLILTYLYSIKYNETNIYYLGVQKHISYKNWINSINILYTDSLARIPIYYVEWAKNFE